MLKNGFTMVSLTLFCWLLFEIPSRPQTIETKRGTAVVSGRVILKGEPVSNVIVYLQPKQQYGTPVSTSELRTKTDKDGLFRIIGVSSGGYMLGALAPGFSVPSDNSFGPQGKTLNISDGEAITGIELVLKRGGVITGHVFDVNGKPVIEERLSLFRLDENMKAQPFYHVFRGNNSYMYRTDDRGIYRLYGLPAGRYLVAAGFAQQEGQITITLNRTYYPLTFHPNVTDTIQAKVIEIGDGDEADDVDIVVGEPRKTYDVYGRVVDDDSGQPVTGVQVSYGMVIPGGDAIGPRGVMGERSNSQGEFYLQGVLPGRYAAFAVLDKTSDFYSDAQFFEVDNSDVIDIEIRIKRGSTISGVLAIEGSNDPLILSKLSQLKLGVTVKAYKTNTLTVPRAGAISVNPDGSFRITGIRPGRVKLSLIPTQELRGFSMLRVEHYGSSQGDEIEVGPDEQVSNIRLVVGYGTNILRGRLELLNGSVPEGGTFFINARCTNGAMANGLNVQVDARGQFTFEGLAPGEYELKVILSYRNNVAVIDTQLKENISKFRKVINVVNNIENKVTITVDLHR